MENFEKVEMPKWFSNIEKRVALFGDGKHSVGNSFTVADFHLYSLMVYLTSGIIEQYNKLEGKIDFSIFNSYPTLLSIFKNVNENPKVQEWNKKFSNL